MAKWVKPVKKYQPMKETKQKYRTVHSLEQKASI